MSGASDEEGFAAGLASESVGVHDAARIGSAVGDGLEEAARVVALVVVAPIAEESALEVEVLGIGGAVGRCLLVADFFRANGVGGVPAAANIVGAIALAGTVAECAVAGADGSGISGSPPVASDDGVAGGLRFAVATVAAHAVPG